MHRLALVSLLTCAALPASGCNMNKMAADTTANVAKAGGAAINGFWDYQTASDATPAAIMQSEALVHVSPNNETLLVGLARTYVSYTYSWVQDQWELADEAGEFERADRLEHRVQLLYRRAADLALRVVRMHDSEHQLDEKLKTGKVEVVKEYLARVFTSHDDVACLYWAGIAWGSSIANSGGDLGQLANAAVARSLLERSVELDPSYNDAGGLGVLGTVEAMFPELFGGSLEKAKANYERALELSHRRNHLIQLGYARNYAVNKQDRELFLKLIHEILDAPDQGSDIRLSNKVARHRAERYLQRVDQYFDPALAKSAESKPDEAPTAE